MSILIDTHTKVLIQGITGREGSRACRDMISYGTHVVAGVTPGKGGSRVDNIPVYDSVLEALYDHPDINISLISVPGAFVRDAAFEALHAGVTLVVILTEHMPTQDSAMVIQYAQAKHARIIGPNSIGLIVPGRVKIGSIGSGDMHRVFRRGTIGIISKSGGMTSEIAFTLKKAGFGVSTAIGIGGDQMIGSDFADLLDLFERDPETRAVVLFGEIGGTYEERAAEHIRAKKFTKPVVALIAGRFSEYLPQETVLGHAGAIVNNGRGDYASKVRTLKRAHVHVVTELEHIPTVLKENL